MVPSARLCCPYCSPLTSQTSRTVLQYSTQTCRTVLSTTYYVLYCMDRYASTGPLVAIEHGWIPISILTVIARSLAPPHWSPDRSALGERPLTRSSTSRTVLREVSYDLPRRRTSLYLREIYTLLTKSVKDQSRAAYGTRCTSFWRTRCTSSLLNRREHRQLSGQTRSNRQAIPVVRQGPPTTNDGVYQSVHRRTNDHRHRLP